MASIKIVKLNSGKRSYRVRVRKNGHYVSSTHRRKIEAERWARREEDQATLSTLSPLAQAQSRTLADMIERYSREVLPHKRRSTGRIQEAQLEFWRRHLGRMKIADITSDSIAAMKGVLAPRCGSTINGYLAVLSHCFTMAIKEWKWTPHNPVSEVWRLPMPQSRTRYLGNAERAKLLFYCKLSPCRYLYPIVVVALSVGPRKNEIRKMKLADYNPALSEIYLEETKNGERRTLQLFGLAAELMRELYDRRRPGQIWFFPSTQEPMRPIDFRYSWEKALEKARIENFCFHDLRHSAASYLAWQGAALPEIQEILGHKHISTTRKYTHLTRARTGALVARMNQAIF